jgi:hypothetical protein
VQPASLGQVVEPCGIDFLTLFGIGIVCFFVEMSVFGRDRFRFWDLKKASGFFGFFEKVFCKYFLESFFALTVM